MSNEAPENSTWVAPSLRLMTGARRSEGATATWETEGFPYGFTFYAPAS